MSELARDKIIELIQKKYGKVMHKVAYDILQDWQFVEDVEQEVLWKLVMQYEEKTALPPNELRSYLCIAIKNTAINMAKKNSRITEAEETYYNNVHLRMSEINLVAFQDKYGFSLEMQELLSLLDNIDKDIICLQYGEGFSRKEIAAALGKDEEFVKKRLYRAKIKLKNILIDTKGGTDYE